MELWVVFTCLLIIVVLLLTKSIRGNDFSGLIYKTDDFFYKQKIKDVDISFEKGLINLKEKNIILKELSYLLARSKKEDIQTQRKVNINKDNIIFKILIIFIPVLTIVLYLNVGSPNLKDFPSLSKNKVTINDVNSMVNSLRERLDDEGGDKEEWQKLAKSYMVLKKFDDAIYAHKKISLLDKNDVSNYILWARVIREKEKGIITMSSQSLVSIILKIEPSNLEALIFNYVWLKSKNKKSEEILKKILELTPKENHFVLKENLDVLTSKQKLAK